MRLFVSIVLSVLTTSLYAQNDNKCDDAILLSTSERIGRLAEKEIADFLLTFGEKCRDNAEFSEWSNELLFMVLDKQTELTLKVIQEEKRIEKAVILDDLSEPINDSIDLKALINKVNKVKVDDNLKAEIIKSLKTADARN
ncbi:MAG: hypothetical protein QM762_04470 [Chryseolinea sp.]